MEEEIVKEIMKECNISKRKLEELMKINKFYGDSLGETKKYIKEFYLKIR